MTKCVEMKKLIVWSGKQLAFRMTKQSDGSWTTEYGPGYHSKPKKSIKRAKTGKMASLMRKHKKWLNR